MTRKPNFILLHEKDNVATALERLPKGCAIELPGRGGSLTLLQEIQFGHKFALHEIAKDDKIIKYGVPIGTATQAIQAGEFVHAHNLTSSQKEVPLK